MDDEDGRDVHVEERWECGSVTRVDGVSWARELCIVLCEGVVAEGERASLGRSGLGGVGGGGGVGTAGGRGAGEGGWCGG